MLQPERTTQFDTPPPLPWDHRDSWFEPDTAHAVLGEQPWTGRTVFRLRSDAVLPSIAYAQEEIEQLHVTKWTAKQHRQLMAQVKVPKREDQVSHDRYHVIEVFSPPRFALEGATRGYRVLSADLSTGWDFRRKSDRENMLTLVRTNPPDLLVLCPPCTWAGGWWHLNRLHMDPNEHGKPRLGPFPVNAPPQEESESPEPPPLIDKSPMELDPQARSGPSVVSPQEAAYGPVRPPRRRVGQKDGPMALYRPGRMAQEDFQDMMQEIAPELLQQVLQKESCSSPDLTDPPPTIEGSSSSSSRGTKRSIESADADVEPVEKRPHEMEEDLLVESATFAMDEIGVCSVELLQSHSMGDVHDGLDRSAKQELVSLFQQGMPCEVLVATYMQKKAAKEIPVTGNPPEIQKKVDEAKLLEWNTIEGKHAGRVVLGTEADDVRRYLSHRIMGSRYVMTLKVEDDAAPRFKARWCLQGHLDPDLTAKAELGDLQSPTLSQVGRNLIFQLLASHQWEMQLGDIKGAFLSAGNLPQRYKPLYASLPKGGIPGIPDGALIEVLGHVYGLNDSPAAWYKKLSHELIAIGFERSRFDSCLFYFRENGKLTGIYGVHVDDCVTGGCGAGYRKAIAQLKQTFEFRKWRTQNGDFCGAQYVQDPKTFEIIMKQERFVQKVKPLHMSRDRSRTREALLNEKEVTQERDRRKQFASKGPPPLAEETKEENSAQ
ncbi:Retrovirus-related Pol polyprotein from transposon RE1 (Retro element 1) (AtRE1) [Includes: Protease RE1 [Durusdinium trenchii]|uniref:Retrovirus-related Pol polyprotein from transposon RE1 (Retro element 1) (AtRE1) n=1 Tax=Durusdinium trenchii TaxID=1381693 RepID=A0ABP0RYE2_9DINO